MRIDSKASSIRFVYPFLFDTEEFDARVQDFREATWPGAKRDLAIWAPINFAADDLLPHVADFLNPPQADTPATALLWRMDENLLRNKLGGDLKQRGAEWTLIAKKLQIPFAIEGVQLALFRAGVGFLSVCAMPTSTDADTWLDFLHYFRFMNGQRGVAVRAMSRARPDETAEGRGQKAEVDTALDNPHSALRTPHSQMVPFFPEPAGGAETHPDGVGLFGEIVRTLLRTGHNPQSAIRNPQSKDGEWWREVFVRGQFLPFATLYVDEIDEGQIPGLLHRVRNFFHSSQGHNAAPEDLRLDNPSLLPYAERMWFVFSLDGGAFVACDAPAGDNPSTLFFRETMPGHLDSQYFLLFLLALHQRFVLMMMSSEVARYSGPHISEEVRAAAFDRIRNTLRWFTARGYFTQVMQQEHHHRCYRHWQETFQVARLYQEVSDEVRDIHEWLQAQLSNRLAGLARAQQERADHLEHTLSRIAWILGPPTLALTFLQTLGDQELWLSGLVGIVSLVAGAVAFWAINRVAQARRDKEG